MSSPRQHGLSLDFEDENRKIHPKKKRLPRRNGTIFYDKLLSDCEKL